MVRPVHPQPQRHNYLVRSPDTTAPAAIANFHVMTADSGYTPAEGQNQGASSLFLKWHPTGDDGIVGTADHYESPLPYGPYDHDHQ